MNDVVFMNAKDSGRLNLFQMLIKDDGSYFDEKSGVLLPELGIAYTKCDKWMLDPTVKFPAPEKFNGHKKGQIYDANAFIAIDGEKYRAQNITAKVFKHAMTFYY